MPNLGARNLKLWGRLNVSSGPLCACGKQRDAGASRTPTICAERTPILFGLAGGLVALPERLRLSRYFLPEKNAQNKKYCDDAEFRLHVCKDRNRNVADHA